MKVDVLKKTAHLEKCFNFTKVKNEKEAKYDKFESSSQQIYG